MWATPTTWVSNSDQVNYWRNLLKTHLETPKGWRAHGLGIVQKVIAENTRVHVWDPTLFGFNEDETTHNHRFSFHSTLIYGAVRHTEVQLIPRGDWQRASFTSTPTGVEVKVVDYVGIQREYPCRIEVGQSYTFAMGSYHRAAVDSLTITILNMGPKEGPSYAIFPPGSVPRHAHNQVPDGQVDKVLDRAASVAQSW